MLVSDNGPRFPHDSYYGGRPGRPESTYDMRQHGRDGYFDQNHSGNAYGMGPGPSRQRASRMQSQPEFASYGRGEQAVYPLPHKDRSYETVTSAAGSGSSADPAGYQTDLTSSDNSSIDRRSPGKAPQPTNDYGIGFNQTSSYQPKAFTVGSNQAYQGGPGNGYAVKHSTSQNYVAPPVPMKEPMLNRRPIPQQPMQRPEPEKRKSWFSRRFSRASWSWTTLACFGWNRNLFMIPPLLGLVSPRVLGDSCAFTLCALSALARLGTGRAQETGFYSLSRKALGWFRFSYTWANGVDFRRILWRRKLFEDFGLSFSWTSGVFHSAWSYFLFTVHSIRIRDMLLHKAFLEAFLRLGNPRSSFRHACRNAL